MHLKEIDWRIEPLHGVIVGIDAGLASIHERIDSEDGFDGISARGHAETLFGLGFVAAQTYALGTVSDLNAVRMSRHELEKMKLECYGCDTIRLKGGVTRIELINASANYFKHHNEWARWPTGHDHGTHDAKTLDSVGITEATEFPCIAAVDLLCSTSWELIVLHQILQEWRAHLFSTFL
ncbi:MAG: hypothetical protein SGJ26_17745 [Nitrospirota bacterium]|nr:hypothetical protein [Nitrospirota bacterium]